MIYEAVNYGFDFMVWKRAYKLNKRWLAQTKQIYKVRHRLKKRSLANEQALSIMKMVKSNTYNFTNAPSFSATNIS